MRALEQRFTGGLGDIVRAGGAAAVTGLMMLWLERRYLLRCYRLVRPSTQ